METTTPTLQHLVVDAGPIIKGERLEKLAVNFWTVPEVIAEIRDSKSRERLQNLPYELKTLEPDAKSMKAVTDFAKKTGDLQAISFNDLKVIALTYMLESQNNGTEHLRKEPKSFAAKRKQQEHQQRQRQQQEQKEQKKKNAQKERRTTTTTTTTTNEEEEKQQEQMTPHAGAASSVAAPTVTTLPATTFAPAQPKALFSTSETFQGARSGYMFKCGPQGNGYYLDALAQPESEHAAFSSPSSPPSAPSAVPTPTPPAPTTATTSSWASIASAAADVKEVTFIPPKKIVELEVLPASEDSSLPFTAAEDYFGGSVAAAAATAAVAADPSLTNNSDSSTTKNKQQKATSRILASGVSTTGNMGTGSQQVADEDDGEGWVNESNFQAAVTSAWGKGAKNMKPSPTTIASAGCITTDFAMQNIMLQMGLKLLAVDGRIVRRLKQWVLKCDACFFITSKMTGSTFCERCGSNAMCRLSVRVQSNGKVEYGYNPYRRISTRGQRFAIATRKGGRDGQGLILRADQTKMGTWNIKSKEKNRVKSQFGEDITGSLGMDLKTVGGNLQAGFGRRNPNAQKGRERRGKRGLKHQKNKRFNPYRTSST